VKEMHLRTIRDALREAIAAVLFAGRQLVGRR